MHLPSFLYDVTIPALEYHRLMRNWCRTMRTAHPVIYDEDHHMWMVFRYEDGMRVRSDYTTFSSAHMIPAEHNFTSITNMDPPRHQKMRSLIAQAFSAHTISAMAPQIEVTVANLLERILPTGKMDWVADLANPLPLQVIAQMLGLPSDDWPHYREWTEAIVNRNPNMPQAAQNFFRTFDQAIEAHHHHTKQDVLALLIAAEVDGQRLSYADLLSFCITLFVAGYITTTNMLGNAILCFYEYPEALEQLRRNRELLPGTIEEVLRYMPPFRASPNDIVEGRTTTTDVHIAGQLIRAGERVQVNRVSVNFDEQQFVDPERFDIARNPNRHQSFGHGIHSCIGAPLARLEAKVAISAMIERLRNMHLVHDGPLEQTNSRIMFGPKRLPLVFQPT